MTGQWTDIKPILTEECVFVTATKFKDHWDYKVFETKFIREDGGYFLALCTGDGELWGDLDEFNGDLYMILPKHKP